MVHSIVKKKKSSSSYVNTSFKCRKSQLGELAQCTQDPFRSFCVGHVTKQALCVPQQLHTSSLVLLLFWLTHFTTRVAVSRRGNSMMLNIPAKSHPRLGGIPLNHFDVTIQTSAVHDPTLQNNDTVSLKLARPVPHPQK